MAMGTSRRQIDEASAWTRRLYWLRNMAVAKPITAYDEFLARIAERAKARIASQDRATLNAEEREKP